MQTIGEKTQKLQQATDQPWTREEPTVSVTTAEAAAKQKKKQAVAAVVFEAPSAPAVEQGPPLRAAEMIRTSPEFHVYDQAKHGVAEAFHHLDAFEKNFQIHPHMTDIEQAYVESVHAYTDTMLAAAVSAAQKLQARLAAMASEIKTPDQQAIVRKNLEALPQRIADWKNRMNSEHVELSLEAMHKRYAEIAAAYEKMQSNQAAA